MNEYLFYDTSSLLLDSKNLFKNKTHFIISSITLRELENIKTSYSKDAEVKMAARALLNQLVSHVGEFTVWQYNESMIAPIIEKELEITPDTKILSCAINYDNIVHPDEVVFVTADLGQYLIANLFFGQDSIRLLQEKEDDYKGYEEVEMTNAAMAEFYQN